MQTSLIDELEETIGRYDLGRRADVLRRVTDLFVTGSGKFSEEQLHVFDDVMGRLLDEVEASGRAAFGSRLSAMPNIPKGVIRKLALDDEISVAGPILSSCDHVDDATLVKGAKIKSQDHLLAISRRRVLPHEVTDVLVDRGNAEVALRTAENPGAQFSDYGYSNLVTRSQREDDLAICIWLRPDIPRQYILKLFSEASQTLRAKLEDSDRRKAESLYRMIARAADHIQAKTRHSSAPFAAAKERVETLYAEGKLDAKCLAEFATAGDFDEVIVSLSFMCDLPIGAIERTMTQHDCDHLLVIAKAIGLSWETTSSLLILQLTPDSVSKSELERNSAKFRKLQSSTAKKAIEFYRLRHAAEMGLTQ